MRNTLLFIAAVVVAVICWGLCGPVLQWGQAGMSTTAGQHAWLRPLVCIGLAYSLIGVVVPVVWLSVRGERGQWTVLGTLWSLTGGTAAAIGALGVVLAFTFGGRPIYVMPLVFGGAPIINAVLTMSLAGRRKEIGSLLLAGVIIVILGSVAVTVFAPETRAAPPAGGLLDWLWRLFAVALAVIGWGAYGPVLHKGQVAMHGSQFRPLLCAGLACLAIVVVVPSMLLAAAAEESRYTFGGTLWSLAGGAAGAIGAVGVAMSYSFGGRPVYVLPLVFGGATIVNTFFAANAHGRLGDVGPLFLAGLILLIGGSAMVLVLARRGEQRESRVESREPEDGSRV